ncbi:hypothetical protein DPMN_059544 [Dreissena polymorpha]|uniref:VWFC domain-containing protein n=1 Tax=Dreissena polymorpha TaxID=45954 RepID=A0A9D4C421_DREPO|nr:hypothetical protein DPMN_059544 [Dreissena polymorpha]
MDPVNPCLTCECLQGGRYACTSVKCPAVNCPFDQQVRTLDGCCMECILRI